MNKQTDNLVTVLILFWTDRLAINSWYACKNMLHYNLELNIFHRKTD